MRVMPRLVRRLRALGRGAAQGGPVDHLEGDLDADARRICCIASFISRGCIWPEPEGEMTTLVRSGLRGP